MVHPAMAGIGRCANVHVEESLLPMDGMLGMIVRGIVEVMNIKHSPSPS